MWKATKNTRFKHFSVSVNVDIKQLSHKFLRYEKRQHKLMSILHFLKFFGLNDFIKTLNILG